ncbi:hypothetical protein [Roseomonas chloroacetimidivorans]|uniref:hypothetical protein n=1 Tax=Roseomonas chloroacetimidivorans TaxID=1766656 RepID=UPI003C732022
MSGTSLEIVEWKALSRNSLRGFATVRLRNGLAIKDVTVHCSNGKRWASLPSKPLIDKDGNAQRSQDGKIRYVPILEWPSRDVADRFSEAVVTAVEAAYPGQVGE